MKTKFCTKCEQAKAVTDFHRSSKSHDGLQSYCATCNNKASVAHKKATRVRKKKFRRILELANEESESFGSDSVLQMNSANSNSKIAG